MFPRPAKRITEVRQLNVAATPSFYITGTLLCRDRKEIQFACDEMGYVVTCKVPRTQVSGIFLDFLERLRASSLGPCRVVRGTLGGPDAVVIARSSVVEDY
jgi:hypothetical protein